MPAVGRELLNIFQVALTIVGTVVGAGFASGQEILQFFVVFGIRGVPGLIISGIWFALLSYLIMTSAAKFRVYSHKELLRKVVPPAVGRITDLLLAFLLLVSTSIMLAGSGAVFRQQFNCHELFGIVFMVFLVLICSHNMGTVIGINVVLVPFLIAALIVLAVQTTVAAALSDGTLNFWSGPLLPSTRSWLDAAALYAGYNMFLGLSGLSSIGGAVSVRTAQWGAILGAVIVTVLLSISAMILWNAGYDILAYPVPLLAEAFRISSFFGTIYSLVILAAMLTTAVVNVYGLARRVEETLHWPHWVAVTAVIAGSIPLSYVGFTKIIGVAYPLIGYGAIVFFLIWIGSVFAPICIRRK